MKNKQKWLWIISIIVIGIAAASCADDNVTPTHTHTPGAAATCVTPQTCTGAGCTYVFAAATGEHIGTVEPFAATCTDPGNSEKSGNCVYFDECGQTVTGEPIAAIGTAHDFTADVWELNTTPATCEDAAIDTKKCVRCAATDPTQTREGASSLGGHDTTGAAATCMTAKICAREGCTHVIDQINSAAHNYEWRKKTDATCIAVEVQEGICSYNEEHKTERDKPAGEIDLEEGHDWLYDPDAVPPTCTTEGRGHRHCQRTGCDADEEGTTPYAALGHNIVFASVVSNVISGTCTHTPCTESSTLLAYLQSGTTHAGTAADPVPLTISINLGTMIGTSNWSRATTGLLAVLDAGGKLVALDLSGSTRSSNGAFSTSGTISTAAPGPIGLSQIASLVMPNTTITSIPSYAFYNCTNLTSVIIPDSVTSIGDVAFRDCTNLTSVTIGNSVTSINFWAFYSCTGLTSITIPNSVTSIGQEAFRGCTGLTSMHIGSGVTTLGSNVFYDCTNLASITVDPANASFSVNGNILYSDIAVRFVPFGITGSVTIPDGITTISGWFQGRTGLTSITIPASVTSIGDSAFSGSTGLTSVTLKRFTAPSTITTLANINAFNNTHTDLQIKVPAAGVDVYKAATNWSTYASRIVAE